MKTVTFLKKITLLMLLGSFSINVQAGWLPQWISHACPSFSTKKTTYIGLGALALAAAGLAGYVWYKNYYNPINKKQDQKTPIPQNGTDKGNDIVSEENQNLLTTPITALITQDKGKEKVREPEDPKNTLFEDLSHSNDILSEADFHNFNDWHAACNVLPHFIVFTPEIFNYDEYCKQNPNHKHGELVNPNAYHDLRNNKTALQAHELDYALTTYLYNLKTNALFFTDSKFWVNQQLPEELLNSLLTIEQPVFDPFVQKFVVPDNSVIAFFGDVHGDIHSLNNYLEQLQEKKYLHGFEITDPNFYMVFLGDYTDRGWYGAEVIYTILRLKCANPYKVILVRGNHEDKTLNEESIFYKQLAQKFGQNSDSLFEKIQKFYETLPLALYLGAGDKHKDFILCCHGGLEFGFDPLPLLNHDQPIAYTKLGSLDRWNQLKRIEQNQKLLTLFTQRNSKIKNYNDLLQNIVNNPSNIPWIPFLKDFKPSGLKTLKEAMKQLRPLYIGFQWNDYEVNPDHETQEDFWFIKNHKTYSRGFILGKTFNQVALALQSDGNNKVHGVFRAHQHDPKPENPMMQRILNTDKADHKENRGVGKLWKPITQDPKKKEKKHPHRVWDNIVCNFNVCPHTAFQKAGFNYSTYGLLKVGKEYKDWQLEVTRQEQF